MAVRKLPNGKWVCDFYSDGRDSKRVRKTFVTRGEALRFEREQLAQRGDLDIDYTPAETAAQRLKTLVGQWYELHGRSLSDGKARLDKLNILCDNLGDPAVADFDREVFANYRKQRLAGEFSPKPKHGIVKPPKEATVNREHAYLRAVFNELKRLGHWNHENPLDGIRLFRESENELTFLYEDDIKRLLHECDNSSNKDLGIIVRICLATGARWSEAEQLRQAQVMPNKITYINTKSKKNRTVPISAELHKLIPKTKGRLFANAYDAFGQAIDRAKLVLPTGQLTHVLRHTFASHFMMNGGNILVLQQILGHSTIQMTMRYSHFAPDHLEAAVSLNPYDRLNKQALR
ncbi:tyrosine-type recombinase/integrase [Yersinia mollaretii]|uniref:phage integrase n=1 Tax=Yersinia mollaretii TaxID=33060 RepID=UPI000C14AF2B|nr:tyrosine-type recombinase/integrase [Yersinia mollaretii]MDA5527044.1 tyrosine-type recombinase/integrase [Yersinia mollaretii]MDR7872439.1 tyrosine-type recombinase/integrase [Yersinia mollaretii]PHZ31880.1 integrase [Yersinia mollaretii]WQC73056.1 tyrosine-type recombinase/integrase [Yersinia mollaretii]